MPDDDDVTDPLPPEDHEKPLQSGTENLERGDYVDDPDGQDSIWDEAEESDDA
jgi:hypothetical protein